MTAKFEHPLQLTVTIPQDKGTKYGVHSTLHPDASRLTIRFNAEERKLVKKWAKELSIGEAVFIRDSAYNNAVELERLHNAYLASLRSG